jgi:hypothetical protein
LEGLIVLEVDVHKRNLALVDESLCSVEGNPVTLFDDHDALGLEGFVVR